MRKNRRKTLFSALSFVLCFLLTLGIFQPLQVNAESEEVLPVSTDGEIIAFAEITDTINVPLGTAESDLPLPATLAATVRLPESEEPSDIIDEEMDVDVPVTWQAVAGYDGDAIGEYTFAATVVGEEYAVTAAAPEITVIVEEEQTEEQNAAIALAANSSEKFLAPIDSPDPEAIPIANRAELEAIKDNLSGSYYLTQDIDLSGAEWVPIGDGANPFTGTFDGQGYAIRNLTVKKIMVSGDGYYHNGLFGYLDNATVKNVGLENLLYSMSKWRNSIYVGGICGTSMLSSIDNCYIDGIYSIYVPSTNNDVSANVGGICGAAYSSSISNCNNAGEIRLSGDTSYSYAGGICGYAGSAIINDCNNSGNVSAGGNESGVGGVSGSNSIVEINNCYNAGDIHAGGSYSMAYAGGISGKSKNGINTHISISNCYNWGAVSASSAKSNSYAGGIYGYIRSGSKTSQSYIGNCYNIGNISASSGNYTSFVGGICGDQFSSTITDCFFLNSYGSAYGTQLTDAQMRSQTSFVGWDFDTVWMMPSGGGYPILQGQENDAPNDNSLKILSFDWVEPDQMVNKGTSVENGIITYFFNTIAYAHQIHMTVTDGAEWTLYSDPECTAAVDKTAAQTYTQLDTPYLLYIKLTKDGENDAIYGLSITRKTLSLDDTPTKPKEIRYNQDYDGGAVTVNWGASLFKKTSHTYNHDLALVAAGLCAAAGGDGSFLADAYTSLGFDKERRFFNYTWAPNISGSRTNEHCFSIASQEIIVNGEKQIVIAVVLRGTADDSLREILGDNRASAQEDYGIYGYKVFDYFHDYADKVWAEFVNYINQGFVKAYGNNVQVLIGGHSLGGAAANLFAARLKLQPQNGISTYKVYAFTFGALNSIEVLNGETPQNPTTGYEYINNIFNLYDTFGPDGDGAELFNRKPAYGGETVKSKFGEVLRYKEKDYKNVFGKGNERYKNHVMACYIDLVRQANVWVQNSKGWIYMGSDGHLVANGWASDSGGWYYMDASGYISTDTWAKDSAGWMFMGAGGRAITNAWVQDSKGWLYLGADGYPVTNGWASDSGGWYYMDSGGYISAHNWVKDSAGWYYMGGNGRMLKSQWLEWNGSWYYLQANGLMATSTITIDGNRQKFDSSGQWIGAA